jgi:hypothetical protein
MSQSTSFSPSFLAHFPGFRLRGGVSGKEKRLKSLSEEQVAAIVNANQNEGISRQKLASFIGCGASTIGDIVHRALKNLSRSSKVGRPPLLNSTALENLRKKTIEMKKKKQTMTVNEFKSAMIDQIKLTDLQRGGNGLLVHDEVGRDSIRKYSKIIQAHRNKGQTTTTARFKAGMDIRNFTSMAVMNEVLGNGLSWHSMGNMDASQFLLQFTNQSPVITCGKADDEPVTREEESSMDIFIKQFFLVTAHGNIAPPLYLVAAEKLNKDACIILKVPHLSFSFDTTSYGYIIFTQTRKPNILFNLFLWQTYVKDFIEEVMKQAESERFYLVVDGEATQIDAIDDVRIKSMLENNKIALGKGPASCSGVCGNALDCSDLFKGCKTKLRNKEAVGTGQSPNSELEETIDSLITNHPALEIASKKRYKIVKGIVHLNYNEMEVLKKSTIMKGFDRIGMIGNQKLEKTLSCCYNYKNIPVDQITTIKRNFNTLVNSFRTHGEIKDSQYDEMKIIRTQTKDKDSLVVYCQRAVWLNNMESISRRIAYLGVKAAKQMEKIERKEAKENEKKDPDPEYKPGKRARSVNKRGTTKNKKVKCSDMEPPRGSESNMDVPNDSEDNVLELVDSVKRLAMVKYGNTYKEKLVTFNF